MEKKTVLRRAEKAVYQVVAGEAILIHMDTGTYYSLSEVATDFWELLDGRTPIVGHAATIAEKYNDKSSAFIDELRALASKPSTSARDRADELADKYGVDPSIVHESLPLMSTDEADEHASELALQFQVDVETVTADLLELAGEMAGEGLVEQA